MHNQLVCKDITEGQRDLTAHREAIRSKGFSPWSQRVGCYG